MTQFRVTLVQRAAAVRLRAVVYVTATDDTEARSRALDSDEIQWVVDEVTDGDGYEVALVEPLLPFGRPRDIEDLLA